MYIFRVLEEAPPFKIGHFAAGQQPNGGFIKTFCQICRVFVKNQIKCIFYTSEK